MAKLEADDAAHYPEDGGRGVHLLVVVDFDAVAPNWSVRLDVQNAPGILALAVGALDLADVDDALAAGQFQLLLAALALHLQLQPYRRVTHLDQLVRPHL